MRAILESKIREQQGQRSGTANGREWRDAQIHRAGTSAATTGQQKSSGTHATTSRGLPVRDE